MLKKSLKIISAFTILLIISISFLLSDFNPIFKNQEFVFIAKEVKDIQKENLKTIIDIHNKIYEKTKESNCPCQTVSNNIRSNRSSLAKRILYYFKIKKEFTPDECLKFVLLNYDFGFRNKGIKAASKFYFKKDIKQLNEKEILTLLVIFRNSGLYNPFRNPEGVANRVKVFQTILKRQKE